ncbi:MAG TPA: hypothetical protein VFF69_08365, partial [Phycisphaerales bacterium]|nr:hypothetical protein [Phycisphaerales bacterium]
ELFWQNVMREMLTSLSMQRARLMAEREATSRQLTQHGQELPPMGPPEGFDGRMAVVTALGERIPIADITPLFACSIGGTQLERALSEDVQCTIFQIHTPTGEVYTFPVQEIRGFRALTEDAMRSLEREARAAAEAAGEEAVGRVPFGFAAFTSLARGGEPGNDAGEGRREQAPE